MKAALSALHYSGASGLLSQLSAGVGAIFTLHHVRPDKPQDFNPNGMLTVTPAFLEAVVKIVVARGFDVISLDDVEKRLAEGNHERPFACFTFDDAYRDNKTYAYPIFKKYKLPFTIFVPTDFPDGRGDLWWLKLEKIIAAVTTIDVKMHGVWRHFQCQDADQKQSAFDEIYWWLRHLPETKARSTVEELCRLHGIDVSTLCADHVMSWDEIRELAHDPLVTIGAHTRRHFAVSKLSVAAASLEISESVRRIEVELGRPCRHFSFPYGDETSAGPRDFALARELGLATAVTTVKGLIYPRHGHQLHALPRLSLNGEFQKERYVKAMLSGAPFAIWNMANKLSRRPSAQETAQ